MSLSKSRRTGIRRIAVAGICAALGLTCLLIPSGFSPAFATSAREDGPVAVAHNGVAVDGSVAIVSSSGAVTPVERRLTRVGQQDSAPSWTPDSAALVSSRGTVSLIRQRVDRPLGHIIFNADAAPDDAAWSPQVSPDGTRILFTHFSGMGSEIRILTPATHQVETVPMPAGLGSPREGAWSPDGARIVFSAEDSGSQGRQRNIYSAASDGSNLQRVTNFDVSNDPSQILAMAPKWSPDGTKVVYSHWGTDVLAPQVEVINIDGTGRYVLATNAFDGSWSPDSSRLAYTQAGDRYQLAISNLSGDVLETLTSAYSDQQPAWSPDGRYLAFTRNGSVWIRSLGPALPAVNDLAVGVSINSGAPYTNSRTVNLRVVAPEEATSVTVANDGGFGGGRTFAVTDLEQNVPWTLSPPIAPLLPTLVYAHFTYGGPNYSDDIVLDTTAPTIQSATATPVVVPTALNSGVGTSIKVKASDNRSGVRLTQVSRSRSTLGSITRASTPSVMVPWANTTSWVRVRDGAGNWSPWQAATRLPTRPSPVVAPRVTYPASGVVRVDWAPPTSAGYPTRLTYRVRVSAKNSAVYGPETTLTLNRHIFRAQPGGLYRVQIIAANGSGRSTPVTVPARPRP